MSDDISPATLVEDRRITQKERTLLARLRALPEEQRSTVYDLVAFLAGEG